MLILGMSDYCPTKREKLIMSFSVGCISKAGNYDNPLIPSWATTDTCTLPFNWLWVVQQN